MIKKSKCRISNDEDLISILDLGSQYLTGIFPKTKNEIIPKAPLQLVWSKKSNLLQLNHTYPLSKMYGDNYGYRSDSTIAWLSILKEK